MEEPKGYGSLHSLSQHELIPQEAQGDDMSKGKTSIFWAIFLLVNAALGAGLLVFPLSFYMSGGVVTGIVIELSLVVFVVIGLLILVFTANTTRSTTFEATVEAVCGPRVRILSELCLVAFCFGSNTAYLVVIADQLKDIMAAFTHDGKELSLFWWSDQRLLLSLLSLLFIFPMLFFRRIGVLSYSSFLSVLCCFFIAIVVIVRYFQPQDLESGNCGKTPGVPSSCSRNVMDTFIALPFICFGYQCHVSSVPIYTDLKSRNVKSFIFVLIPAIFICFCVYTATGIFGYFTFHSRNICIASDIMVNYCPHDIFVGVSRGLLVIVIITSYPILTFCGRTALDSILVKLWIFCRRCLRSIVRDKHNDSKNFNYSPSHSEVSSSTTNLYEAKRLRVESGVWFFISLLLAIFVKEISYILSLTGGLAASFIFLFPGLILIQYMLRPDSKIKFTGRCRMLSILTGCIIIFLGTFIFGLSVVYTVMHDSNLLV